MATKYSPYESIKSIYDLKKQWDDENKAGNRSGASAVAQNAQRYYNDLKNNGYADVAEQLSKVDYTGAKGILDKYAGTGGKTAIRPFFQTLAKSANLSGDEVNNLIKYDDKTGHVSFAGTDIGRPDAASDGVSYWDKDYLKGVWDNYVKNSKANDYNGVKGNATYNDRMESSSKKSDEQYNQLNEHNAYVRNEYEKLLALANTPYSESEEYKTAMKAVMPYYDYAGYKASYGVAADGASTNSGNVDTFAAANAARQRNAQISQGAQMAYQLGLAPYQQRIENINNILSSIGAQRESITGQQNSNITNDMTMAQMAFDNGETQRINEHTMNEEKLNNATARKEVDAGIELAKDTLAVNKEVDMAKINSSSKLQELSNALNLSQEEARQAMFTLYDNYLKHWAVGDKVRNYMDDVVLPILMGEKEMTPAQLQTDIVANTEKYNIDVDDAKYILGEIFGVTDLSWLDDYEDRTGDDQYKGMRPKSN